MRLDLRSNIQHLYSTPTGLFIVLAVLLPGVSPPVIHIEALQASVGVSGHRLQNFGAGFIGERFGIFRFLMWIATINDEQACKA